MIQRCWTNFKLTYDDSAQDQRHLDLQKAIRSKSKPGMINRSSKTQRRDKTGKVADSVAVFRASGCALKPGEISTGCRCG